MHQALSLCVDTEEPTKPIIYKQIVSQTHLRKRFVTSGYASGSALPSGYRSGYASGSASARPTISARGSMGGSFTRMAAPATTISTKTHSSEPGDPKQTEMPDAATAHTPVR